MSKKKDTIIVCRGCGKVFEDKRRRKKEFCSHSCLGSYTASIRNYSGKNNPNWKGRPDTPCAHCGKRVGRKDVCTDGSRKNYCSRDCANEAQRKGKVTLVCPTCKKSFKVVAHDKDRRRFCSIKCSANDPEILEIRSKTHKGKIIPEWHRQAVSEAISIREPEKRFSYGKSGRYLSPKAGDIFYRSSYEKIAYEMLDADETVLAYRPEPFVIKYQDFEGSTRRYRPDVLVSKMNGNSILVEVKPEWRLQEEKTIVKLDAGRNYANQKGWGFEVWTEKELGIK